MKITGLGGVSPIDPAYVHFPDIEEEKMRKEVEKTDTFLELTCDICQDILDNDENYIKCPICKRDCCYQKTCSSYIGGILDYIFIQNRVCTSCYPIVEPFVISGKAMQNIHNEEIGNLKNRLIEAISNVKPN